ncbi:hypothetical protein KSK55_15885 [Methanospirillum purgamenti]|uniref:Uncharacterized protein n=1 Tax=Methanospirillum hungatei TaxID=2203 RepID=A0A8F5VN27_METHU|nr:hypothetical protein [Methanospirillum hungatei]QXO94763.1 hypothetical protein KSK55_15885 [Methanospirillum hungatei]
MCENTDGKQAGYLTIRTGTLGGFDTIVSPVLANSAGGRICRLEFDIPQLYVTGYHVCLCLSSSMDIHMQSLS